MGLAYPAFPVQFLKPQTALTDPASVVTVPFICQHEEVDWEVELCVVIGQDCKDVAEADAMDYVLGYTVANDVRVVLLCVMGRRLLDRVRLADAQHCCPPAHADHRPQAPGRLFAVVPRQVWVVFSFPCRRGSPS